jgi:hypothetical protein
MFNVRKCSDIFVPPSRHYFTLITDKSLSLKTLAHDMKFMLCNSYVNTGDKPQAVRFYMAKVAKLRAHHSWSLSIIN